MSQMSEDQKLNKFADILDSSEYIVLLHISTRGGQGVNNLANDIRKAFDTAGINYDRKKFTPHITLVRKSTGNPGKITIPNADMMVKKVSLMRSDNVQGKIVYKEIYHI